jgi:hypothetical protein
MFKIQKLSWILSILRLTDSFLPNKMEELQKQAKLEKIVEKENLAKQF